MKFRRFPLLAATAVLAASSAVALHGQGLPVPSLTGAGEPSPAAATRQGPHGGTLRLVGSIQAETIVSPGGLQVYLYAADGQPIAVTSARGSASVAVPGNAKRYRYDLFPSEENALAVAVDLSPLAGRQIAVDYQLVGIPGAAQSPVRYRDVTTIPADQAQADAIAIARQKVCPVSGKPLGSMGRPVAIDANGQRLFVCCAGCVGTVQADPAKYASGRPDVVIAAATDADAPLIARQKICPVMDEPLGSMGKPIKLLVSGKPLFLCCKGCIKKVQAEPEKYLAMITSPAANTAADGALAASGQQVRDGVFRVTAADQPFVAAQQICPVMEEPLDAMGGPYRVDANGRAIYICCPGCAKKITAEPEKYLALLGQRGISPPLLR